MCKIPQRKVVSMTAKYTKDDVVVELTLECGHKVETLRAHTTTGCVQCWLDQWETKGQNDG